MEYDEDLESLVMDVSFECDQCSQYVENAYSLIRTKVEKLEDDRLIGEDILAIADLIRNRKFTVN